MQPKAPADPLDVLASQAEQQQQAETPEQPGQPVQQPPQVITNAQAIAGAIGAGREAFCFFTKLQSPRKVLDDGRVQQLAGLADPVLTKYGINVGAMIGDFGPELALAAGLFAVVLELRQAVTLELAAKKPKGEAQAVQTVEPFTSANDGQ